MLDRYIFSETIAPFLTSVSFCLLIFIIRHLLMISDMIVNQGIDILSICLLIVYAIPYFIQYIIPISVVIAVLIVCLKMADSNEIIALKASGIGVFSLVKPISLFATSAMLITGITTICILPSSEKLFKSVSRDILTSGISMCLREGIFNDRFDKVIVYINHIDRENKHIYDVFIEDTSNDKIKSMVIAPRGKFLTSRNEGIIHLKLFNGFIVRTDINKSTIQQVKFNTYNVYLSTKDILSKERAWNKTTKEMSLSELRYVLNSDFRKNEEYYKVLTQYHKIFSIPLSCLSMSILALSLGVNTRRFNKSLTIGLSITLFLGYYLLFSICTILTESGLYNSAIWIYFPNILTGLIGIYFLILNGKNYSFFADIFRLMFPKNK